MHITTKKTLCQLFAALAVLFGILSSMMGQTPVAAPISQKPIPQENLLEAASKSVESLFAGQQQSAKLPHQKAALVRTLLTTAAMTVDDVAAQYILFQKAIQIASEVGDIPLAFQAIEKLDANFEGTAPLKSKANLCKRASTTTFPLTTSKEISKRIVKCITEAVDAESFDDAVTFLDAGMSVARRQNASSLIAELEVLNNDVKLLADQFAEYADANKKIQEGVESKELHKVLGTYLSLRQYDWINGEKHLAICEDGILRPLIVREIEPPTETSAQIQLADDWWQISESYSGAERMQARASAAFWYQKVLVSVEGLTKRKIQARLATVSTIYKVHRSTHSLAVSTPPPPSDPTEPPKPPQRVVIDILQTIADPTSHAKKGTWQITNGELVPTSSRGIFSLPVRPSGSYQCEFEFFRASGNEVIIVTLPVAKRQVYIELSCQGGACNAMSFIKGRHSDNNGTASNASRIRNGEWNSVKNEVDIDGENCSIICKVNNKVALDWSGEWRDLGIDGNWGPNREDELGLASVDPGVRFRKLFFIGHEIEKQSSVGDKASEIRIQIQKLFSDTEQRIPNIYKDAMTKVAGDVAKDMQQPELKEPLSDMFNSYVKAGGVCGTPSDAKFPDLTAVPDSRTKVAIGVKYSVTEGVIAWYHFDPAFEFFVSDADESDKASRDIIKSQFEITISTLTYAKGGRMFSGLPHEVDVKRALEDISSAFSRLKMRELR